MQLTVNGTSHELELDPRTSLLDALRDHLGLVGTRKGCDHGQCGACTVRVGGRRINSCLALAVQHDGDEVVTVEGLADDAQGAALQEAFVAYDAYQCGYCTSGQLCAARALVDELREGLPSVLTPPGQSVSVSDDEIRERMSGNLCRCGAYVNLLAAIRSVLEASP